MLSPFFITKEINPGWIIGMNGLVFGLAVFVWLAAKNFKNTIYLTIFLLPLYFLKIKIFFAPFNILEILIWLLFGIWLLQKKYRNIEIAKYQNIFLPALILLMGTILATLLSENLKISAGILKGWFVAPMIFALIIITDIKTQQQIKEALWSLSASDSLVSFVALFYFLQGKLTYDGRLTAFFLSPNHLAMYLAPGFLIALCFACFTDGKKKRLVWIINLLIIGTALYLTLSYAAWLSVLIAAVFLGILFFRRMGNKKFLIFYFLLLVFLMIVLGFSQFSSEKFNNLMYSARSSWQSRLMIWRAAWEILKDHSIFGIGPGMFQEYYLKYQGRFEVPYLEWAVPQPHNLFLAFWLQSGLAGLIGFIWLLIVFFKKIFGLFKNRNQLALILFGLMGYIILHGLADTTYWKNDLAVIFWMVIAFGVCLRDFFDRITLSQNSNIRYQKSKVQNDNTKCEN